MHTRTKRVSSVDVIFMAHMFMGLHSFEHECQVEDGMTRRRNVVVLVSDGRNIVLFVSMCWLVNLVLKDIHSKRNVRLIQKKEYRINKGKHIFVCV